MGGEAARREKVEANRGDGGGEGRRENRRGSRQGRRIGASLHQVMESKVVMELEHS